MSEIYDLLSGTGNEADALGNSGAGSVYADNQSAFDVADNGKVTSTNGTTTVSSPSWGNSLASLFNLAGQASGVVGQLTGKTTAPAATVAQPNAGSLTARTGLSTGVLVGIGLAIVAAVYFFIKRR